MHTGCVTIEGYAFTWGIFIFKLDNPCQNIKIGLNNNG